MIDTIYRDEAIEAVCGVVIDEFDVSPTKGYEVSEHALSELPSAGPQTGELISREEPTVIRSRTFMPTNDFKEWAKRIREVNPNAVVIPCDAEVVSAETLQNLAKPNKELKGSDLISRDVVLANIDERLRANGYVNVGLVSELNRLFGYVRNIPSAEAVQGEWIETSEGTMCGNCHKFPYDDGEYHIANWHSDFCPNCGCVMDNGGGENE